MCSAACAVAYHATRYASAGLKRGTMHARHDSAHHAGPLHSICPYSSHDSGHPSELRLGRDAFGATALYSPLSSDASPQSSSQTANAQKCK